MQQRRAQRLGVEAHAGADARHPDWVHDEVLARLAPLGGVVLAGEHERVFHALAVDLYSRVGGVLGDDREQIVEQPPLELAQLCAATAASGVLGSAESCVLDIS